MASYNQKSLTENRAPARDDAYTVMLSISLLAMIGACVILFYDLKRFPDLKPPAGYGKAPAAVAPPGQPQDNVPPPTPDPMAPAPAPAPEPAPAKEP